MGTKEEEAMKKEGARGFAIILQELEDGVLHREASEQMQTLVKALTDHAYFYNASAVGKLNLELTLKCDEKGQVTVVSSIKTVTPKRKRSATTMWATEGNNLSPANPRQVKLPLAAVPEPTTREVPATAPAAVRSV
jgi:hypothetical protein